jgi:hypothetical protein
LFVHDLLQIGQLVDLAVGAVDVAVDAGDGFGGVFAGFLLLGGFVGDDDVVGGAAVVATIMAKTK